MLRYYVLLIITFMYILAQQRMCPRTRKYIFASALASVAYPIVSGLVAQIKANLADDTRLPCAYLQMHQYTNAHCQIKIFIFVCLML